MSTSLRPVLRALFAFFVTAVGGCGGSGGYDPANPDTHIAVSGILDTNVVDLTQVISTLLKDSLFILAVLSPWVVLFIASRRFEKRRRDQGAWNESGRGNKMASQRFPLRGPLRFPQCGATVRAGLTSA